MLGSLSECTRDVDPEVWRRYLGIVTDGLRTSRDEPNPLRLRRADARADADDDARLAPLRALATADCVASQKELMLAGELYRADDPQLAGERLHCRLLLHRLNAASRTNRA